MKEYPLKIGVVFLLAIVYELTSIEGVVILIGAELIVNQRLNKTK
jgi:hypothetical protein